MLYFTARLVQCSCLRACVCVCQCVVCVQEKCNILCSTSRLWLYSVSVCVCRCLCQYVVRIQEKYNILCDTLRLRLNSVCVCVSVSVSMWCVCKESITFYVILYGYDCTIFVFVCRCLCQGVVCVHEKCII